MTQRHSGIAFATAGCAIASGHVSEEPGRQPVAKHFMTANVLLPRTQIAVLAVLLALTGATVGVSFLEMSGRWHLTAGLGIAAIKAALVALFFMHLIHSRAAPRAVAVVAVFWLVAVLVGLTMADYLTRGWIPFAPGH
jgi:cytochrome c oxidase subunit 4